MTNIEIKLIAINQDIESIRKFILSHIPNSYRKRENLLIAEELDSALFDLQVQIDNIFKEDKS